MHSIKMFFSGKTPLVSGIRNRDNKTIQVTRMRGCIPIDRTNMEKSLEEPITSSSKFNRESLLGNDIIMKWVKSLFQNAVRIKLWTYVRQKAKYSIVKKKKYLSGYDKGYLGYSLMNKIFGASNIVTKRAKNRPTKFPYKGHEGFKRLYALAK